MSHRRFVDRSSHRWEIRVRGKGEWEFRPISENPSPPHHGEPPHWARDPFELSEQELQTILGDAAPAHPRGEPSPFRDDSGAIAGRDAGDSLFEDSTPPTKPRSPFLDDRDD